MNTQIRLQQLVAFEVLVVGFGLLQQQISQENDSTLDFTPSISTSDFTPTCCCTRMCMC